MIKKNEFYFQKGLGPLAVLFQKGLGPLANQSAVSMSADWPMTHNSLF